MVLCLGGLYSSERTIHFRLIQIKRNFISPVWGEEHYKRTLEGMGEHLPFSLRWAATLCWAHSCTLRGACKAKDNATLHYGRLFISRGGTLCYHCHREAKLFKKELSPHPWFMLHDSVGKLIKCSAYQELMQWILCSAKSELQKEANDQQISTAFLVR